jgi:hypothetical protein
MKSRPPPAPKLGLILLIVLGLILIALGLLGFPAHQRFGELVSGPTLLFVAYIYYDVFMRRRSRQHTPRPSLPDPPSQIKGRMPIKLGLFPGPREQPKSAFLKPPATQTAPTKTEFMKLSSAKPIPAKPASNKPAQAP